jgi:hypothetical protein
MLDQSISFSIKCWKWKGPMEHQLREHVTSYRKVTGQLNNLPPQKILYQELDDHYGHQGLSFHIGPNPIHRGHRLQLLQQYVPHQQQSFSHKHPVSIMDHKKLTAWHTILTNSDSSPLEPCIGEQCSHHHYLGGNSDNTCIIYLIIVAIQLVYIGTNQNICTELSHPMLQVIFVILHR